MIIVCGQVGGALFMLPGMVFGPPTHLHIVSSPWFLKNRFWEERRGGRKTPRSAFNSS